MAWIESHQSLLSHRKTIKAAKVLGISKYLLIGHLQALWWWALDNVGPDGDLDGVDDEVIEDAAGWSDGGFADALRTAGFITGNALHDWYDYGGKLQERRVADRNRKRAVRGMSAGSPQDVSRRQHNSREDNTTQQEKTVGAAAALYEASIGSLNSHTSSLVDEALSEYGEPCVLHSLKDMAANGAKSWKYAEKIMARHKAEGCESDSRSPVQPGSSAIDGRIAKLREQQQEGITVFGPLAKRGAA